MKITNYENILVVGQLQRIVLSDSTIQRSNPLKPIKKGVVNIKTTMELGIGDAALDKYYVAVSIVLNGKDESDNKQTFTASCKMFGFYTIENATNLNEATLVRAARARGALQIYPIVRSHLMYLSRTSGVRFKIPLEIPLQDEDDRGLKKKKEATDLTDKKVRKKKKQR